MKKIILLLLTFFVIKGECMACGGCTSTINSTFNSTSISASRKIWFSAVLKIAGPVTYPLTIYFKSQTITSRSFFLTVPDGELILTTAATTATTVYDGTKWVTTAPPSMSGNYFISGYCDSLRSGIAGGLNPVSWSGEFLSSRPVSVQWEWAASVYTSFNSDLNSVGVKPSDCSSCSSYINADHAGTPERYKSYLTGGAKGTGGTNYTGTFSSITSVSSCPSVTPSVTINASATTICHGASVTFTASSVNGGTRPAYQWKKNGMNVGTSVATYTCSSLNNGDSVQCILTSSDASAAPTVVSSNVKVITVNPLPSVAAGSGVAIYAGTSTVLSASGAATYTWSHAAGLSATTGAVVTASPTATTSYTVTGTSAARCSASAAVTVSVNALPLSGGISGSSAVCVGATDTLTYVAPGGTWHSSNAGIATISSSGVATGVSAGNVTISYTLGTVTATKAITVNPLPVVAAITGGTAAICAGDSTDLNDATAGGTWSCSNYVRADVSSSGLVTSITWGIVNISYTVTNECGSVSAVKAVTMNALPAIMDVTGGGAYCVGGTGVAVTLPGSAVGVNYQLYRNDTAIGSPVPGAGCSISLGVQAIPGVYTITATNPATGCISDMSGSTTVSIAPLPDVYTVTGGGSYCAGGEGVHILLSNSDTDANYELFLNGVPLDSLYAGTGAILDFGALTDSGIYTVGAANGATGCASTMEGAATVVVNPLPYAGTICGPLSVCTGASITLTDSSCGGVWSSSDSSIVAVCTATGVCTGMRSGYANVTYAVSNSCGTATSVVTIRSLSGYSGERTSGGQSGSGNSASGQNGGGEAANSFLTNEINVNVYPNPNKGSFNIDASGMEAGKDVSISVTDVLGQVVYRNNISASAGMISELVALGNSMPKGMYLLTVQSGEQSKVFHVVVE